TSAMSISRALPAFNEARIFSRTLGEYCRSISPLSCNRSKSSRDWRLLCISLPVEGFLLCHLCHMNGMFCMALCICFFLPGNSCPGITIFAYAGICTCDFPHMWHYFMLLLSGTSSSAAHCHSRL